MPDLIQVLEQLAVSTSTPSQRHEEIGRLTASADLSAEVTQALETADLSGLIQAIGMTGRGCFVIVAPDEPEQPDEDAPEETPVKIHQH